MKLTMKRLIALTFLVIATAVATQSVVDATIYFVEPYTLQDYEILGGTIETNTVGPLTDADIIDYEIIVDGQFPFTFHPSNTLATIFISGAVIADGTSIFMPPDTDPDGSLNNLFRLQAQDDKAPFCTFCEQYLQYDNALANESSTSRITYIYIDIIDFDPNEAEYSETSPQRDPFVIATVPEPSTVMLSLLGMFVAGCAARQKSLSRRN